MNTLRVLVVEEDASVLNACCSWLIDEGCEVSTQRTPSDLQKCIRSARAEVVLVDPLMRGLSSEELLMLLTRCRHPGAPSIILHSRLSEQMLSVLLNTKDAHGVIRKTDNAAEFTRAFRALTRREWKQRSSGVSGTHRIDMPLAEVVFLPTAQRRR